MASKNVSFDTIPSSIRKPGKYFEFNTRLAVRNLPGNLQRVLLVGQRLASGQQKALETVRVFSDTQARDMFGAGSQLHLMVLAAITCNPYTSIECIALDDEVAGIAARGSVKLTGTATCMGTVSILVGKLNVLVTFDTGDSAADIMQRVVSRINLQVSLPVVASFISETETIELIAKNNGEVGNSLGLSASIISQYPAGIDTNISGFAGGANNPDIDLALSEVFAGGHNIIVSPYLDANNVRKLRDHVDAVSGSMEQRGAIAVIGTNKSLSTATTLASSINSGRNTLGWHNRSVCSSAEIAASYGAVIASEEDPARPLNTLVMKWLDETPISAQPGRNEQEAALHNGVTPFEIGPGGTVQIVRAITTYTLDPQGIEDVALLDLTTIRTLDYVRKACRERIALRFPRDKLSERTAVRVRSELIDVLVKMEDLEILECVKDNLEQLIVERDEQDVNRLNAAIPADVVNGLHVFAGRIDLLL